METGQEILKITLTALSRALSALAELIGREALRVESEGMIPDSQPKEEKWGIDDFLSSLDRDLGDP